MTPDPQNSIGKIKSKSHWRDIAVASTTVSTEDLPVLIQVDREAKFVWSPVAFGTLAIVVLFVLFFLLPPSRLKKPSKELVNKVIEERLQLLTLVHIKLYVMFGLSGQRETRTNCSQK